MAKTICIYHGNCADGFAAAWVFKKYFTEEYPDQEVEFYPGIYQTPPPDVTGKDVVIVDFSYKRNVIEEMLKTAANILIIDHHASAIKDLEGLEHDNLQTYFDLKHSGSMLTWHYFFGDPSNPLDDSIPLPELLKVIEHRDLWKFSDPPTEYDDLVRKVQANVFSYPYDFDVWDMLMGSNLILLAAGGEAIERKHFKDIKELLSVGQRRGTIGGYDVPICNLPYILSSDAGDIMSDGQHFAACWMETKEGFVFSLRSQFGKQPQAVDVSEIAMEYGGGGHKTAAGFKIANYDYDLLDSIFGDSLEG